MAKRFIDTEIFNDSFFMNLTKDSKLLYIYLITNCNHAGIIELNDRLCKFQTGINNIDISIKELGNRLVTVSKGLYFIPKFIDFQYPKFPNSNVRQQASAIEILKKHNLFFNGKLTVTQPLTKGYEHDNGNEHVIEHEYEHEKKYPTFDDFWNEYDKKVGSKTKIEGKWNKLTQKDRESIMEHIPKYKQSQPQKQYRKNPETYLNNESWNDEIIPTEILNGSKFPNYPDRNFERQCKPEDLPEYWKNLRENGFTNINGKWQRK